MNPDSRLKVMTIVGTRPEIIRLSRVIPALDRHLDHVLVHTGQNHDFELNGIFFRDLEMRKPDHFLGAAEATPAATIGRIIADVDEVLARERPDAVLILGDTNSALAAIPAKRRKIPVFHMEAGNRCFDQRVPEEINRRIVDHIADINLCYSQIAREYLLREGLPADRVIVTGSPMREVLEHNLPAIQGSPVLDELALSPGGFFLVSAHREENVDDDSNLDKLAGLLDELAGRFGLPVLVSTHPRTRKRFKERGKVFGEQIRLLEPLGFHAYVRLQTEARAVLSDSGTITEESSILNFPALNIRFAHERPEGMEEAAVMMTGLELDRVLQGLAILETQGRGVRRTLAPVADYGPGKVSEKIVRILISYTDYVQRTVWSRER